MWGSTKGLLANSKVQVEQRNVHDGNVPQIAG